MPKITTDIQNSKYNPFGAEDALLGAPGQKYVDPYRGTESNTSLEGFSDFVPEKGTSLLGNSDYAKGAQEERLAHDQGSLELLGKFAWNTGATALFEAGKILGYLGGAAGGAIGQVGDAISGKDDTDFMETMVDNGFVKALSNMEQSTKDLLPVHISQAVAEGKLTDKLSSGQWWATTGADGAGFLLSMMLPGQILKSIGLGGKIAGAAETLGNNWKGLGKLMGLAEGTADIGMQASKGWIKGANGVAAAAVNTFGESAAEAANTFDNVKTKLISEGKSEDEAKQIAGEKAASVFKANIPLLLLSNGLDEAWLWKSFGGIQKEAGQNLLSRFMKDGVLDIEAIDKIKKMGFLRYAGEAGLAALKGATKEGFIEGGTQTMLQKNIEGDKDRGNVLSNIAGSFTDIFGNIMTDVNLQESIALGAILGGGMNAIGSVRNNKETENALYGRPEYTPSNKFSKLIYGERKAQSGLVNLFKDNFISNYRSIEDVYMRDKDGKILRDENGTAAIDQTKLAEMTQEKADKLNLMMAYDEAIKNKDEYTANMIMDNLTADYSIPFFQQEGGMEVLRHHIKNQLGNAWANRYQEANGKPATPEQIEDYTKKFGESAENLYKTYKEVEDLHSPERMFHSTEPEYQQWKNRVFTEKLGTLVSYKASQNMLDDIKKEEATLGAPIDEILANEATHPSDVFIKAKILKQIRTTAEKDSKTLGDKYKSFYSKEGLEQHYEDYKKDKAKTTQQIEELGQEAIDDTQNKINRNTTFAEQIKQGGYQISERDTNKQDSNGQPIKQHWLQEPVIAKDNKGNRFVIKSRLNGQSIINELHPQDGGNPIMLTDKVLKDMNLEIISKENLKQEHYEFNLAKAKAAKLRLIDEIINHRNKLFGSAQKETVEINKRLEEYAKQLEDYQVELQMMQEQKIDKQSIKELEARIQELEETVKNAEVRKQYLEQKKFEYTTFITEYQKFKELVTNAKTNISFKKLKSLTEERILKLIDEGEDAFDSSMANIQKAIVDMTSMITKYETLIDEGKKLIRQLRSIMKKDRLIKQIILTLQDSETDLDEFIKRLNTITVNQDPNFFRRLQENVKTQGLNILDDKEQVKQLKRLLNETFAGQTDEYTNSILDTLLDKLLSVDALKEKLQIRTDKFARVENIIQQMDSEIRRMQQAVAHYNKQIDIKELNRQFLALEEFTKKKVEEKFEEYKNNNEKTEDGHTQPPTSPAIDEEQSTELNDKLAEHSLGSTWAVTTGLNVTYHKDGNHKGQDELTEEGLPKLNPSVYQQAWFKILDLIDRKGDVSKYRLRLYNPKYDNSDNLEKAIGVENGVETRNVVDGKSMDVFAVLTDENGNYLYFDSNTNQITTTPTDTPIFSSIWQPHKLFPSNGKPRLQEKELLRTYIKHLLGKEPNASEYADNKGKKVSDIFKTNDAAKIVAVHNNDLTYEELLEQAINYSRQEYTKWFNSIVNSTTPIFVQPQRITTGKPLTKRNPTTRKVQWNNVLENTDATLPSSKSDIKERVGQDALQGGKILVSTNGTVKTKEGTFNVKRGDVILSLDNGRNALPLQSRTINQDEARLVLYLLSLGHNPNPDTPIPAQSIQVPLPKGVFFKLDNTTRIEGAVPVFFGNPKLHKNFSLLHTIISYGRKQKPKDYESWSPEQKTQYNRSTKGQIFYATNKDEIIYTDWDGTTKIVKGIDLFNAIKENKFEKYNADVADLFNFLLNKRHNISQNLVNNNLIFPRPVLKTKDGVHIVEFDTKQTYYEHLLQGKNAVLSTSAVKDSRYPNFVQRNMTFDTTPVNPKLQEESKATVPDEDKVAKALVKIDTRLSEFKTKEEVQDWFDNKFQTTLKSLKLSDEDSSKIFNETKKKVENKLSEFKEVKPEAVESKQSIQSYDDLMKQMAENSQNPFDSFADKRVTPKTLLEEKIKSGEIQQICK